MTNFQNTDAVLIMREDGTLAEPRWPKADFIVGNPPFLGGKKLRDVLGDEYVEALFGVWDGRVPGEADYCCYWFEKTRQAIVDGRCERAGLLATQGIRGGANRVVLQQIKQTGDLFFAVSDSDWVLDGAMVRVSMVGFDDGTERAKTLDGVPVQQINADLTADTDTTSARVITSRQGISFMGDTKSGSFDVKGRLALDWLNRPNPHGRPNSDVLRPWVNGRDVNNRERGMWIIDYPAEITTIGRAAKYEAVFEYARRHVEAERRDHRTAVFAERWWQHERPRPEMRAALVSLPRFIATARVAKHRLFVWLTPPTLPDSAIIVFALPMTTASECSTLAFTMCGRQREGHNFEKKRAGGVTRRPRPSRRFHSRRPRTSSAPPLPLPRES